LIQHIQLSPSCYNIYSGIKTADGRNACFLWLEQYPQREKSNRKMLNTQQYLREGGTIDELQTKLAISAKPHSEYKNLFLLKYDQIESDFSNPIVKECRGLILDSADDWRIVNYSMNKFHNHGELLAAPIDWQTAKTYTKEDGSLAQLYAYDGKWHMATSGNCSGEGQCGDFGFSFNELFWSAFKYTLPQVDLGICFFFELCSKYNKIIVQHFGDPYVVLLGARNLTTLKELTLDEAHAYFPDCKKVKTHPLGSFDECIGALENVSPLVQEGFVICDANFNRVKLKSLAYVALHHLKDSLGGSHRALLEVVRKGEIEEVCASFPEFKNDMMEYKHRLDALICELEHVYSITRDIPVQKEFALKLEEMNVRCRSALFSLRANKVSSVKQYLQSIHIDQLVNLLDK
jgi:hypothetical protein